MLPSRSVEDIETIQQDVKSLEGVVIPIQMQTQSLLLSLPLEIRLKIYTHLMDIHPISHRHLVPNPDASISENNASSDTSSSQHTTPDAPRYIANRPMSFRNRVSLGISRRISSVPESFYVHPIDTSKSTITKSSTSSIHAIPISMLLTNKQIYAESRLLPFRQNTWIFMNWFYSGLNSAISFSKMLEEWQRNAMRFVGVEIGGVELVGWKGSCAPEWLQLCALWKGVHGVSLSVRGKVDGYGVLLTMSPVQYELTYKRLSPQVQRALQGTFNLPGDQSQVFIEKSVLDIEADWVIKGLKQMESLRYFELAILDRKCGKEEKLKFEKELKALLGGVQVRIREL